MKSAFVSALLAVPNFLLAAATCDVCGARVAQNFLTLDDGRFICEADTPKIVLDRKEAEGIFARSKAWCHKNLSGFGSLPDQNIVLYLLNKTEFEQANPLTGPQSIEGTATGLTRSWKASDGNVGHKIYLMSAQTREATARIGVHEFGHAWINENTRARNLAPDAAEGFCEWLSYKFEGDLGHPAEQKRILAAAYTHGQISAFVAAEQRHGFEAVINWVKSGLEAQIDPASLDRILVLRDGQQISKPKLAEHSTPIDPFGGMPVFAPSRYTNLVLKSISGTATRRFALINNQTLAVNETAKVRLGESNVSIRCVEIRDRSAVVQVQGEAQLRTILLNPTEAR